MNIQDNYPYFESNQVLTHSQLNELFNYLDQQNRLTRAKLIGIGIVCGLDVVAPAEGSTEIFPIKIAPGIGITSEGYLVVFEEFFASYRRAYTLPDGVHYDPFEYEDSGSDEVLQYELTELITNDDYIESTDTVLDETFLEDKVVIVFLEMYDYDPRTCLVRSCDEIGQTRYVKTRVLVASREIAENIREKTGLIPSTEDIFPERFDLPVISMKRVKLAPEDFDVPGDAYSLILNKYRINILEVYQSLIEAIKLTYTTYQPILLPLYTENPFETAIVETLFNITWNNYIQNETLSQNYFGMQYFYDFIKDLILAYDEFRIEAFDIVRKCNIDMSLFPRHLFLGEAYPSFDSENNPEDNRNGFTQPTIYKDLQEKIEKAKSLHQRIVEMIKSFNLVFISDPNNGLSLKITPSDEKQSFLSNRSIPFYYNYANAESRLLLNWNYELTRRNQSNQNLSYHASDYSAPDHVKKPLDYNYDKYPFLRIGGNAGASFDLVVTNLQALKKDNNIPFDFKLFNLNDIPENIEIADNNSWKDLQTEYISIRDSLTCALQKLVKNLKTPEGNEFSTEFENLDTQITELYPEILDVIPFDLNTFQIETFSEKVNELFDKLIDYNLYIKYLFGKLLYESYHINTPQVFHEQTQILNDTFHLIRHFMSNCIVYKLITVYYRYQYRKGYLQENSLELFPNFLKEHPGIEHDAGVCKRGTYIMLHDEVKLSPTVNENRIVADFALPYMCCSQNQQIPSPEDEADNLNLPPLAVADYYDVIIGDSEVPLDILNNDLIRDTNNLEITTVSETTSGGTVVQGDDGVIRYTHPEELSEADYLIDSFNYTIRQTNGGEEDSAPVKVLVRPPYKLQPKAVDDIEFTNIDTEIVIDVLKNDYYNDDTVIELQLQSPNSALGATLAIEIINDTGVDKQVIRYTPLVTGRDSFKYSINYPSSESEPSIGEVSVFVGTTSSFAALIKTVQKNSTNNKISVLNSNEESLSGVQLTLLNSAGDPVTDNRTEHGTAIVPGSDLWFEYSPNSEYFGADVIYYQVTADHAYSRIDSVNILVMCCCINLPDHPLTVNPNEEYVLDLNLFTEEYPNLQFLSIGILDRDIVEANIKDETHLHFVPTNDIVFAGQYTLEYYATDNNTNCYKGKINLTSGIEDIIIPDINVHLTILDTVIIEIPVAEKYGFRIKSFEAIAETLGELTIINNPVDNAFQYKPAGGIENVHAVSFNYILENSAGKSLSGKINLINLISNLSLTYNPETVQKNSVENQLNVLKESELEFNTYELFIIDSEDNTVTEAKTPHGKVIVHDNEEEKIILYTPNNSYFGTDIFEYQIVTEEGYYRRGTVNLIVMCCCLDIPDYNSQVTPGTEYEININLFADIYSGIRFKSLGQFNREIVNAGIISDSILTFIPSNDIVYAGKYSFEYFATDDNKNCYKGKINLTPDIFEVELPDINVNVTTLNPIVIPVEVAEKYQWKIQDFVPLNGSYGVLSIINDSTFNYIPAEGLESVLMATFNYTLVNKDGNVLNGKVNLINMISSLLQPYVEFWQINKLFSNDLISGDQFGYSVDIYDQFAIIGVRSRNIGETINNGTAYIFIKKLSGQWSQHFELINEDLQPNNFFGHSVAIYDIPNASYYALVGASGNNGIGAVYSFRFNLQIGSWESHAIIKANDAVAGDSFGNAIDINNNIAVVGAYLKDLEVSNTGCAYIFGLENGRWVQLQRLQASDGEANDYFGYSVNIHGSTIVVGAYAEDSAASNSGSCYIYEKEGDEWVEVQKILPENPEASEYFGYSSAIYGDWIVVGSVLKDMSGINSGSASVYRRDSANKNNWILFQTLQADDMEPEDRFGISVVIENETIIVGSFTEDTGGSNTGSVYVFKLENNEWVQKQKIQPADLSTNKYFGYAIGLQNNQAIIGAYNDVINEVSSGSAYIFEQIPLKV
ncbi:MAG: hypothetical protein GQ564_05890 [Bacteroidales bacterium]|nr:hypothetical protein [Bacteroidales bacterium]